MTCVIEGRATSLASDVAGKELVALDEAERDEHLPQSNRIGLVDDEQVVLTHFERTRFEFSRDLICRTAGSFDHVRGPAAFHRTHDFVVRDVAAVPGNDAGTMKAAVLRELIHEAERGVEVAVPTKLAIRTVLDEEDCVHARVRRGAVVVEHEPRFLDQTQNVRAGSRAKCNAVRIARGNDAGNICDHRIEIAVLVELARATRPDHAFETFKRDLEKFQHRFLVIGVHALASATDANADFTRRTRCHEGERCGELFFLVLNNENSLTILTSYRFC